MSPRSRPPVPRRARPEGGVRGVPLARVALASLLFLGACEHPDGGAAAPLELELLGWIAPGTRNVPGTHAAAATDLLVDRFEVTRGQWAQAGGARIPAELDPWPKAAATWPVVGMDLAEARAFAAERGMRLLTEAEWLWCAGGTRGQPYPYGPVEREGVANTQELGLGRPAPVGTFASGRTPGSGLADLLGNVWEWTEPARPGDEAHALGGSFRWRTQPLVLQGRSFHLALAPEHRSDEVGLRCCAEAEAWLRDNAGRFDDPDLRARVEAVGARWGRAAAPTLERLVREPGASPCLQWLLAGARR